MSDKNNNIQKIDKYLNGKLDNKAMHQIEREAQDDPFFTDALDGYEKEGGFSAQNFSDLRSRLNERVVQKQRNKLLLWRVIPIAACLLLMIGAGYWFSAHKQKQLQYANNIPPVTHKAQPQPVTPATISKDTNKATVEKPAYIAKNKAVKKTTPLADMLKKVQRIKVDSDGRIAEKDDAKLIARVNAKEYKGGSVDEALKKLPRDIAENEPAKGSIYPITGKEVQDNPIGNKEQLLQGKVADLNSQNGSKSKNNLITISGIVTDNDGKVISGANVYNGSRGVAKTDTNGRYHALINKDSLITFTNLGYRTQSFKAAHEKYNVVMQEQPTSLAEVNIRGYVKRNRDEQTGSSYIITGKANPCKENARFKRRFFKKIAIAEKYVTEHANKDTLTVSDGKFYRALKFITEHAPSTIKADKAGNAGYSDLQIFELNKTGWLNWYESNKCNNLK